AWRPGGSGTRYRVGFAPDGLEGWLGVGNLRSARSAVSPAPTAPARPAAGSALPRAKQSEASGRPFGQRAHRGSGISVMSGRGPAVLRRSGMELFVPPPFR